MWKLERKKFEFGDWRGRFLMFQFGKNLVGRYPSPSLPLSKAATGAGFAKLDCKILSPKGLEVKILRTNDLGCLPAILSVPLSLCNHLLFKFFAQGQMSQKVCGNPDPRLSSSVRKSSSVSSRASRASSAATDLGEEPKRVLSRCKGEVDVIICGC